MQFLSVVYFFALDHSGCRLQAVPVTAASSMVFFLFLLLCLFNGISFTFVTSGINIDTVLISYVIFDPSNSLIWIDSSSGFHGSFHGSPEKAAAYISLYLFVCSILQGCISIMYVINLSSDQLIVFKSRTSCRCGAVFYFSHFPHRVQPLQMIFIPQVWHLSPK